MKTIEESAKEYADKICSIDSDISGITSYMINSSIKGAFILGAGEMDKQWKDKFRWISFEEKFPPIFADFEVKDVRSRVFNISRLVDKSYLYLVKNYSSWRLTPKC